MSQIGGAATMGGNVTDATLMEFYEKLRQTDRLLKKAQEEAEPYQAEVKSRLGEHRAMLKKAKGAGVSPEALSEVLAMERLDKDIVLSDARQKVRLMALSGQFPSIQISLFDGLNLAPPEGEEAAKMEAERAYDEGYYCGRDGKDRSLNKHLQGTEIYDAWDRGWLAGQKPIAEAMAPKGRKGRGKAKLSVVENSPPAPAEEIEAPAAGDLPEVESEIPFE